MTWQGLFRWGYWRYRRDKTRQENKIHFAPTGQECGCCCCCRWLALPGVVVVASRWWCESGGGAGSHYLRLTLASLQLRQCILVYVTILGTVQYHHTTPQEQHPHLSHPWTAEPGGAAELWEKFSFVVFLFNCEDWTEPGDQSEQCPGKYLRWPAALGHPECQYGDTRDTAWGRGGRGVITNIAIHHN